MYILKNIAAYIPQFTILNFGQTPTRFKDILHIPVCLYTWPTPAKFNIAPDKWWLEDEFPFGIAYFLGAMLNFPGCNEKVLCPTRNQQIPSGLVVSPSIAILHQAGWSGNVGSTGLQGLYRFRRSSRYQSQFGNHLNCPICCCLNFWCFWCFFLEKWPNKIKQTRVGGRYTRILSCQISYVYTYAYKYICIYI